MSKSELLYQAIELHPDFKPIEFWEKLPYSTKMLFCERAIESESYKDYPHYIVFHIENNGAHRMSVGTTTINTLAQA